MSKHIQLLALLLGCCIASSAFGQARAPLVAGMTLEQFVEAFNRHANWAGRSHLLLSNCQQRPTFGQSKSVAYFCQTETSLFVAGIVERSGELRDVTVHGVPATSAEMHDFSTAATYMVRAVKGTQGEGLLVSSLMGKAVNGPASAATKTEQGVLFSAHRDPELGWTVSAERAAR